MALDAADGRVAAADVRAVADLPPFPSSAMDGFAVRAADTPGTLGVELRASAGRPSPRALRPGEAIGIATGAVVPDGADAVVPVEVVVDHGDTVEVPAGAHAGDNVRPRGGDLVAGGVAVPAGTTIGAAQVAALAAAGVSEIACARRPRVSILATGTELRPPGVALRPGEIYESNGPMLAALLRPLGVNATRAAPVEDDRAAHREALERALDADIAITTGGVSVGPHDLVREVGVELGVTEVFWRVAMRPGKPLFFGVQGSTLVFGLPGNPVSSLVGALLFVAPAVLALQGATDPLPRWQAGSLARPVQRNVSRDDFARAAVSVTADGALVDPIGGQESHMIVNAASADALAHIPRGEGTLPAGAPVRYLWLG